MPLLVKDRRISAGSADVAIVHLVGGNHDERHSIFAVELDEGPSAKAVWVGTGSLVAATEAMHNPGEGAAQFLYAQLAGRLLVDPARSAVLKNSTPLCSHRCRTAGFRGSVFTSGRPRPYTSMSQKLLSISHKSRKFRYLLIPFGLI